MAKDPEVPIQFDSHEGGDLNDGTPNVEGIDVTAVLEGVSEAVEVDLTDMADSTAHVPMDDVLDFEITPALRELAAGYENLGEQIANGWIPSALLADLLYGEEKLKDADE